MQADKQVQAAFDLLADKARYDSILRPRPQAVPAAKIQPVQKKDKKK